MNSQWPISFFKDGWKPKNKMDVCFIGNLRFFLCFNAQSLSCEKDRLLCSSKIVVGWSCLSDNSTADNGGQVTSEQTSPSLLMLPFFYPNHLKLCHLNAPRHLNGHTISAFGLLFKQPVIISTVSCPITGKNWNKLKNILQKKNQTTEIAKTVIEEIRNCNSILEK